ncbi:MAG: hypothetical protein ABIQ39_09560 [Ilumatobacteraceae bacterium]
MTEWTEIKAAITLALSGDREGGSREMARCWEGLGDDQHAQQCVLAHYLADVQDDLDSEVIWDERALVAFGLVGENDLDSIGIVSAAGLAPSLHLNLGDCYLRQGRVEEARGQLQAGMAAAAVLGGDGYGTMIRSGLDGLGARLGSHP